jgi:general secretion pathway protein J
MNLRRSGFSLIELLVALAVFAALAAAAYGGLAGIAATRGALARQQDRFAQVVRAVSMLERDLRQAISRPVRGNGTGEWLPALAGTGDRIELTRVGFANPLAEPRSNLERVADALDAHKLERGRYAALDRAPGATPVATAVLDGAQTLSFRYAGSDGAWRSTWPPSDAPSNGTQTYELLPHAIEFRIATNDVGELRRVVELPTAFPDAAIDTYTPQGGGGRAR